MYSVHFKHDEHLAETQRVLYRSEDGKIIEFYPEPQFDNSSWNEWGEERKNGEDAHASFIVDTLEEATALRRDLLSKQDSDDDSGIIITLSDDWSEEVEPESNAWDTESEPRNSDDSRLRLLSKDDLFRATEVARMFHDNTDSSGKFERVDWDNLPRDVRDRKINAMSILLDMEASNDKARIRKIVVDYLGTERVRDAALLDGLSSIIPSSHNVLHFLRSSLFRADGLNTWCGIKDALADMKNHDSKFLHVRSNNYVPGGQGTVIFTVPRYADGDYEQVSHPKIERAVIDEMNRQADANTSFMIHERYGTTEVRFDGSLDISSLVETVIEHGKQA